MEIKNYHSTNFITGLRGYAILMVLIIHYGGFGLRSFGIVGNNIVDAGKNGVFIFFVISGFAITHSFLNGSTYKEFLIRRVFRIIPMFYLTILLFWALGIQNGWMERFNQSYSPYNLLAHFLFLFSWDYSVAFTIPGVEWTLGIEIFWYILLPLVLKNFSYKKALILIVAIVAINYANKHFIIPLYNNDLAYHISPLRYGYVFLMGSLSYYIRKRIDYTIPYIYELLTIIAIVALFWCLYSNEGSLFLYSLITFIFIVSGHENNKISSVVFENKLALIIGTISYSLYLVHILVIEILPKQSDLIYHYYYCLIAIVVSIITYHLVEKPCNRIVNSLFKKD
jgi:exopolysaccharide production protein ExoZ